MGIPSFQKAQKFVGEIDLKEIVREELLPSHLIQ